MSAEQVRILLAGAMAYQMILRYKSVPRFRVPSEYRFMTELGFVSEERLGAVLQSRRTIVAAFRGTEGLTDIVRDLQMTPTAYPYLGGGAMTHRGFTDAYTRIREKLLATLKTLDTNKTLLVTGHSLGGALATLAAPDILSNTGFKRPVLITFGSPRVGNPQFASAYDRLIPLTTRIYNVNDLIPRLPPESFAGFEYRHVGGGFPISFQAGGLLGNHEMDDYLRKLSEMYPKASGSVCGRMPGFCPDGEQ